MAIVKTDTNIENMKFFNEALAAKETGKIDHPVLKRCAEEQEKDDPAKDARQAYDRMHHRHNRS